MDNIELVIKATNDIPSYALKIWNKQNSMYKYNILLDYRSHIVFAKIICPTLRKYLLLIKFVFACIFRQVISYYFV